MILSPSSQNSPTRRMLSGDCEISSCRDTGESTAAESERDTESRSGKGLSESRPTMVIPGEAGSPGMLVGGNSIFSGSISPELSSEINFINSTITRNSEPANFVQQLAGTFHCIGRLNELTDGTAPRYLPGRQRGGE